MAWLWDFILCHCDVQRAQVVQSCEIIASKNILTSILLVPKLTLLSLLLLTFPHKHTTPTNHTQHNKLAWVKDQLLLCNSLIKTNVGYIIISIWCKEGSWDGAHTHTHTSLSLSLTMSLPFSLCLHPSCLLSRSLSLPLPLPRSPHLFFLPLFLPLQPVLRKGEEKWKLRKTESGPDPWTPNAGD